MEIYPEIGVTEKKVMMGKPKQINARYCLLVRTRALERRTNFPNPKKCIKYSKSPRKESQTAPHTQPLPLCQQGWRDDRN